MTPTTLRYWFRTISLLYRLGKRNRLLRTVSTVVLLIAPGLAISASAQAEATDTSASSPPVTENNATQQNIPNDEQDDSADPIGKDEVLPGLFVDSLPVVIHRERPFYPDNLGKDIISGGVLLLLTVDTKGDVSDIKVVRHTDERFAQAGVEAAKKWKFKPALSGGRPVNCKMRLPMVFSADKRARENIAKILEMDDKVLYTNLQNKPRVTEFHDPAKLLLTHSSVMMKLLVAVEIDGSVREVSAEKQPSNEVEEDIFRSVLRWKFEKGLFKGQVVPYHVPVIVWVNPTNKDGKPIKPQGVLERPLVLCVSPALPLPTETGSAAAPVKAKQETSSASTPASPVKP